MMENLIGKLIRYIRLRYRKYTYANPNEDIQTANPTCAISDRANLKNLQLGKHVKICGGSNLVNSHIGDFTYVSFNSIIANAEIGKFCSIAENVQIGLASHPSRGFVSTHPVFYSPDNSGCVVHFRQDSRYDDSIKRTVVGHDVWIGQNAIIPGGINIGTGAIIAAGAVVVKDVPEYTIIGGNPARVIRTRFSPAQIQYLMREKWWDWPVEKLKDKVDRFTDIELFMEKEAK